MTDARTPGQAEPLPGPLRRALERAAEEVELGDGELAVVYGAADRGELAAQLASHHPAATVVVAAQDARQAAAARERAEGASVVVVAGLAEVEGAVALVALVPGGYEGKERWREMVSEAASRLEPGGSFVVVTHARRGAASLAAMIEEEFGAVEVVARGWGGMRVLRATRAGAAAHAGHAGHAGTTGDAGHAGTAAAHAAPTTQLQTTVLGRSFTFATAPGVFSRGRLDPGTRLLLESVDLAGAATVLDLGCGYGPIGIAVAATKPGTRVTMIDVDARAVDLARRNATRSHVEIEAIVADGPAALPGRRFDLILSHFPLHAPKGDRDRLTREAHEALTPGGRFCAVVLSEYDLTPTLERFFGRVRTIAADDRYVVLCAAQ